MSIEGQGHFLTLAQGRVHIKIQTGFSKKLLYRSEPNLKLLAILLAHLSQRLIGELIVYRCSGVRRRRRCYINDDPGLTLTYFMARSNLVI